MYENFPLQTSQGYIFFHTKHPFLKVKYSNRCESHETNVKYNRKIFDVYEICIIPTAK